MLINTRPAESLASEKRGEGSVDLSLEATARNMTSIPTAFMLSLAGLRHFLSVSINLPVAKIPAALTYTGHISLRLDFRILGRILLLAAAEETSSYCLVCEAQLICVASL